MINKIDKVISRITGSICYVGYAGIVFIMLLTVIDVFTRKVFHTGIVGSYELIERTLLIMIFAAFADAQVLRGHIHVTLFLAKFPRVLSLILFGLFGLLSTAASAVCSYALLEQGRYCLSAGTTTAVLFIPHYPFYYIAAFCMLVFTLVLLWDSIKCFIGIAQEEVGEEIRSYWE